MTCATKIDTEIACSTGEIYNGAAGLEGEVAHRATSPSNVETKGHDAVDEVVPGCDRIKHLPNGGHLVVANRKTC